MRSILLACGLAASLTATAAAQSSSIQSAGYDLLDSYVAFIGADDLYNSSGQRLTQPWQIIRQDRANFHRFGVRDRLDQDDAFFDDATNRVAMEQMLRKGSISPAAARDIVSGGALIFVEVYGRGTTGYLVQVTTAR